MPAYQEIEADPNPYRGIGEAGKKFFEVINKRQAQSREDDAVKQLVDKYRPGMSQTEYLQETLRSGGNLPLEKRAAVYEALTQASAEDEKRAKEQEKKKMDRLASQALAKEYGLQFTPEEFESLTPAQVMEAGKNKLQYQKNADAAYRFMSRPDYMTMNDQEFGTVGLEYGLDTTEIARLDNMRKKTKEQENGKAMSNAELMRTWMPFITKIGEEAEAAEKRQYSYDQIKKNMASGKTGPNLRNIIGNWFKGSMIGNLIEQPENLLLKAQVYQSIIGTRADFGVRLTDTDLKLVLDKVVSADKPEAVNLAIMKYQSTLDEMAIEKKRIAQEIRSENNGIPRADFDIELSRRMKESPVGKKSEDAARELLELDDKGNKAFVWVIDPDTGEKERITKDRLSKALELGFEQYDPK